MFLAFIGQYTIAYTMLAMPDGAPKWTLFDLHKSIGLTLLLLVFVRIGWRLAQPLPSAPHGIPAWQRRAARGSHYMLYLCMLAMPLSGYVGTYGGNFVVNYFSLFEVPNALWWLPEAVPPDWIGYRKPINVVGNAVHRYTSYLVYALVSIHASAALWHHFVHRDSVLRRMLPGMLRP